MLRIVQIIWLIVAAVCAVESYVVFSSDNPDKNAGWLFAVVGVLAISRYIMLKRSQLKKQGKI